MLIAVMYLIYVSLGLPDSLLGSGWPVMKEEFGVPSSYAGYVFMTIAFMTMVFGNIQERTGIGIMPVYLLIFAVLNFGFLELTYRSLKNEGSGQ